MQTVERHGKEKSRAETAGVDTTGGDAKKDGDGVTLLNRLFLLEEINGMNRCPTYLFRWTLLAVKGWFGVYLHHFVGEDWSRDLHDHPKRFISIGLRGGYVEHTPRGSRLYRAPWLRSFPASHIHRLTLGPFKDCWTLVIVLWPVREWGFWHLGQFVHWKSYVRSDLATAMKACQ